MRFLTMLLLWTILFVLCWPAALLFAALLPIIWLIAIPFRIAGFAIHVAINLITGIALLPLSLVLPARL